MTVTTSAPRELMEGSEALARAAVASGCRFFAGYPMTPFTELLEHFARLLPDAGGVCINAESELEAVGMDFDALRAASTRIVMAAGAESEGELANRSAFAVAERLGTEPVIFPSDHGGFFGGEYGQTGDPDAFAAKLREVLAEG